MHALRLVNALVWRPGRGLGPGELCVRAGRVCASLPGSAPALDLQGRLLLPGFVNGHDHLELASLPALGRPPYASLYAWADDVGAGAGDARAAAGLALPALDRLFLGGLRNLLSGVTTVAHHGQPRRAFRSPVFRTYALLRHRLWLPAGFPARVPLRYGWAHSPGLGGDLRRARERTPPGAPFVLHAAEGTDARAGGEVAALAAAGLLGPQTRLVHAVALSPDDVRLLRDSGAGVIWCPESNRKLYGATAPVAALRAAGVPLGLGSDSPISGGRDFLSSLAAARRELPGDDEALLRLATVEAAALLGLPRGALEPGDPADLLVAEALAPLLRGERSALALVLRAGRPLLGEPGLMQALGARAAPLALDGRSLALEAGWARLLGRLLGRLGPAARPAWLEGLELVRAQG